MYLATLHCPNLNPIGAPSVFAACVALGLAAATSPCFRLSAGARELLTACAPMLLLCLSGLTEGSAVSFLLGGAGRCFPNADDRAAEIMYNVFGFVFALNCFGLLRLGYRIVGWLFTIIFGSTTALLTVAVLTSLRFMNAWRDWRDYLVLGAVPVFIAAWLPVAAHLDRNARARLRRQKGCCQSCAYDLTGNVSGVCPECGTATGVKTA